MSFHSGRVTTAVQLSDGEFAVRSLGYVWDPVLLDYILATPGIGGGGGGDASALNQATEIARLTTIVAQLPAALGGAGGLKVEQQGTVDVSDRAGRQLGILASIAAAVDISDRVGRLIGVADISDKDARILGRAKLLDSTGAVIDPATKAQLPAALVGGRLSVDASGVAVPVTDNGGSLTVDAPVGTPLFARLSDGAAALIGQKVMASSLPVTLASDQSVIVVGGNVAHDGVDSGNPQKVGGMAKSALPAAVADGDRVNAIFDLYGRQQIIIARPKILGNYKFESGRLTVQAAAHGALVGFFWLINPVGSAVIVFVKKLILTSVPTAVTAFASSPRITVERVTFTGVASGAQITAGKRDSTDAAAIATLRTASTGLTLTAGAIMGSGTVPAVLTAVGIAVPLDQWLFSDGNEDEDDYSVLRAGEGLVVRQPDAGTAADTRLATVQGAWEER